MREGKRSFAKGMLCMLALLSFAGTARADLIRQDEDPKFFSVLASSEWVYGFVACALADRNWAQEQLDLIRTRPHYRASGIEVTFLSDAARVFGEVTFSADEIEEEGEELPDEELALLRLDEGLDLEEMLFGGGSEMGTALVSTGLGVEEFTHELPAAAEVTLTFYAMLNKRIQLLALFLRDLLGLEAKFRDDIAENHVESSPGSRAEYSRTRRGSDLPPDEPFEDEDPKISMKQVVRSAFKIALGAVLGILLFAVVRRF